MSDITFRRHLATQAMVAIWTNDTITKTASEEVNSDLEAAELCCKMAWNLADMMLKFEHEKPTIIP
jgi:spermidine/putrescine-binding protein